MSQADELLKELVEQKKKWPGLFPKLWHEYGSSCIAPETCGYCQVSKLNQEIESYLSGTRTPACGKCGSDDISNNDRGMKYCLICGTVVLKKIV